MDQVYRAGYGQHDAGWLSFYDFFARAGIDTSRLNGLIGIARSSGWFWPFAGAVVLTDRPSVLHRDQQGRLHCDNGPALLYRDGFAVYAWHGLRIVNRRIIDDPKSITVADIDAEPNAELRRVMLERYGAQRYIVDSGAKEIGRDHAGVLYRKELRDDEPLVMVRVVNSTPEPDGTLSIAEVAKSFATPSWWAKARDGDRFKEYWLRVPPTMTTAAQAVAWTFSKDKAADYAPSVET